MNTRNNSVVNNSVNQCLIQVITFFQKKKNETRCSLESKELLSEKLKKEI